MHSNVKGTKHFRSGGPGPRTPLEGFGDHTTAAEKNPAGNIEDHIENIPIWKTFWGYKVKNGDAIEFFAQYKFLKYKKIYIFQS
jgi:hypothetical protein